MQRLARRRRWRVEQRPLNQMGHVGRTFPCLHHPCTLSPVPRLTLTVTHKKTPAEGKIHSHLINLGPGTDARRKRCTLREETHTSHRGHHHLHLYPLCPCLCASIQQHARELLIELQKTYDCLFSSHTKANRLLRMESLTVIPVFRSLFFNRASSSVAKKLRKQHI